MIKSITKIRFTTVRNLWKMLTPKERRFLLLLLVLTFIGMVLETVGIGLIIPVIALLTQSDYGSRYPRLMDILGQPSRNALVIIGMVGLVVVYVVKNTFLGFFLYVQSKFNVGMQIRISRVLFRKYLFQPYEFHLEHNSATLIRNIEIVGNIGNYGIVPAMSLITEVLVLVSLCVLLIVVEPIGAISVVVSLGLASYFYHRLTKRRISSWSRQQLDHAGMRYQHLQQGLGGIKDVVLLGREERFLNEFDFHNAKNAEIGRKFTIVQSLPRLWMETLAVAGLAILVMVIVIQDRAVDSVIPTIAIFAATAFRLMPSANRILGSVQSLRYGYSTINTLSTELARSDRETQVVSVGGARFAKSIELTEVSYSYPNSHQPALRDISLNINMGESIGLVGPSGAGKSTLVDVILGLLTPTSGAVTVDGVVIQSDMRNWQGQVGYVPQSIYLTDDTLRRNVGFGLGDDEIDDGKIWEALGLAQLIDFIKSLPEGLDTLVGERGVRLSGGQRQRIGIARALYHNPTILVLDEATSSLDTATEHEVMEGVNLMHGSKTIIIVAHRFSTVEYCDRLYRLDGSRVISEGTFEAIVTNFNDEPSN